MRIIIPLIILALFITACTETVPQQNPEQEMGTGHLVFTITDSSTLFPSTELEISIESVALHNQAGWINIPVAGTYRLDSLNALKKTSILAEADFQEGNYDAIRIVVSDILISDRGASAKLPSHTIQTETPVNVAEGTNTLVAISIDSERSLHLLTQSGKYVFTPVLRLQVMNDVTYQYTAEDTGFITIQEGTVQTDTTIGMGLDGSMGEGLIIPSDAALDIVNNTIVYRTEIPVPTEMNGVLESGFVFAITDAYANMGNITNIMLTVKELKVKNSANQWMMVWQGNRTIDLIELRDAHEMTMLTNASINSGVYGKVLLIVDNVKVVDQTGEHDAFLPGTNLEATAEFKITKNEVAVVSYDFIAKESVHVTTDGTYVFGPAIQVKSWNAAKVQTQANNRIRVTNGLLRTDTKVGMDLSGTTGEGKSISTRDTLEFKNGKLVIKGVGYSRT
ncbi:MAG: DUF4382 domain-containing protein [Candidatus Woesearchaeota archaeon]